MYQANVYNVMVASPSDVEEEKNLAIEVILDWNAIHSRSRGIVLLPLHWRLNSHPEMGDRPQGIINKQILEQADLLVAIFWTRLGTPTGKAASGTVEEIAEHRSKGKQAMIYFSSKPIPQDLFDLQQVESLKKQIEVFMGQGILHGFTSSDEFKHEFRRHLDMKMNEKISFNGFVDAASEESAIETLRQNLSDDALRLLKLATGDRSGQILFLNLMGVAFVLQTNNTQINKTSDAREKAKWLSILKELEKAGFIAQKYPGSNEGFIVTPDGYDFADTIVRD